MKKGLLILTCIFLLAFLILVFRPISITTSNCEKVKGIVTNIKEGPSNDIVINLLNEPTIYYINRGLEQGLSIDKLNEILLNKNASICYAKHWTPLDPFGKLRQVSELQTDSGSLSITIFKETEILAKAL